MSPDLSLLEIYESTRAGGEQPQRGPESTSWRGGGEGFGGPIGGLWERRDSLGAGQREFGTCGISEEVRRRGSAVGVGMRKDRESCSRLVEEEEEEEEEDQGEEAFKPGPVPVYVMLPLDMVNAQGVFRYESSNWFAEALGYLAASGVAGVAVDVWWGGVEREPGRYDWSGYHALFDVLKRTGLKLQVVLSFHACGGNVNDFADIPLPKWVLKAGEQDPDLFYANKPRNNQPGQRNKECISLFADRAQVLEGRSPLQCYEDLMVSFKETFFADLGPFITEVVIGCGPCGELRYPSYVENHGWQFPGVGEFQCYDRRALASLARAAKAAGHPEWGFAGPHDAGNYNSVSTATSFFKDGGSWDTPYGQFFLKWYSDSLLEHGDKMLSMARKVFVDALRPRSGSAAEGSRSGSMYKNIHSWVSKAEMMLTKPSSTASFTDMYMNTGSTTMSRRTESFQSFKQSMSPETLSTAMPSTQSMDMLDVVTSPRDAGDENDILCVERLDGSPSSLHMSTSEIHDPLRCLATAERDGSTSPSSGSDLITFNNAEGSKGLEAGVLAQESSHPPKQWDLFRRIVGFLGGRTYDHPGIDLRIKIAGVHWWYLTRSHAAELTAGYFNTEDRCGYKGVLDLCMRHAAKLTLTCVEMCDSQHPWEARCSPQGLLRQVWVAAARCGVELSGENALPLFRLGGSGGNIAAFDRIVKNARNYLEVVGMKPEPDWRKQKGFHIPVMGSFTFLRLGQEILCPQNQGLWMRFMHKMHS